MVFAAAILVLCWASFPGDSRIWDAVKAITRARPAAEVAAPAVCPVDYPRMTLPEVMEGARPYLLGAQPKDCQVECLQRMRHNQFVNDRY